MLINGSKDIPKDAIVISDESALRGRLLIRWHGWPYEYVLMKRWDPKGRRHVYAYRLFDEQQYYEPEHEPGTGADPE